MMEKKHIEIRERINAAASKIQGWFRRKRDGSKALTSMMDVIRQLLF